MPREKNTKEAVVKTEATDKAIISLLDLIKKKHGNESINRLRGGETVKHPTIKTGIYAVDNYVLNGGLPKGRIVEIFGPESSGKTTLCLQTIAQAQKAGLVVAFVDAEHALDPKYAASLGVDLEKLLLSQPDSAEQALEIVDSLVRSGMVGMVVVDSVAALVPKAELDGDMGDSVMGLQARLMSQACRKLTGAVAQSGTCLVLINQIRMKIGVMFGSPETTTGGRAIPFFASVRLDIRKISTNKDGDEITGNQVRIKCVKNRFGPPFREAEVGLEFGKGFDGVGSLLDFAVLAGVVERSGAWYSYKGERLGQGKEACIDTLRSSDKLRSSIEIETAEKRYEA